MATIDGRMVSRPRGSGRGRQGSGACWGSLDDLPCEGTQELAATQLAMLRRAQEFFQTCDKEGKGFIARADMQVRGPWAGPAHLECQGPGSPSLGLGPVSWDVTSLTESESVSRSVVLTLCNPLDCSPPGSSVHGISQAKILEWVAISFSRESSQPKDQSQVS